MVSYRRHWRSRWRKKRQSSPSSKYGLNSDVVVVIVKKQVLSYWLYTCIYMVHICANVRINKIDILVYTVWHHGGSEFTVYEVLIYMQLSFFRDGFPENNSLSDVMYSKSWLNLNLMPILWWYLFHVFRNEQLEQERRDRELALRLAQEDQSQVEDLTAIAPK